MPGWQTRCHHLSGGRPRLPVIHRTARPVTVLLTDVAPTVRNSNLETLPITNWHSLLVITDCRTSCKRIRLSRSTGQAIEISHCTPDTRGWSALKVISVLLNKTVEPVPAMA